MINSLLSQSLFAICNSSNPPLTRLAPSLFWSYIHLLESDLANQTIDPLEDAKNKPYRPIPSGRLSLEMARTLRWALLAFCTLWSAYCSKEVLAISVFCNAMTYVYDDLNCLENGHWTRRNICVAIYYFSFELGACVVKGEAKSYLLFVFKT